MFAVGSAVAAGRTVYLRSHPRRLERLRFDQNDLDLALQQSLLDEQRTFEFLIVAHVSQADSYLTRSRSVLVDVERA